MNVIITMAGEGSRFSEIGILEPKHLIQARGKTLFEWALLSLENFFDGHFIFITREHHAAAAFISEKCRAHGLKSFSIHELDYLTKGQADTVLAAEDRISDYDEEIIIYNIDTYVEPEQLQPGFITGDGWIPAFEAEGDRWSFVKTEEDLRVVDIAEKVKISNRGTIGLYYFKTFNLFRKLYRDHLFDHGNEHYIAPIYRGLIDDPDASVYTHMIDTEKVHVLGTPEDIRQFDPEFGRLIGNSIVPQIHAGSIRQTFI